MLTGEPSVSGDVATTATAREAQNEGGEAAASASASAAAAMAGGSNSGEDDKSRVLDEADRAFGGNRWPRQETLALLKIRSDMDAAFRDASLKGPLWEEVSRKLAELGYNRSAKKCKEKFENVYKYHKRTKDGRTSKGQGKSYRFFDQLEAFESHPSFPSPSPSPSPKPRAPVAAAAAVVPASIPVANPPRLSHTITTVPSTTHMAAQNIVTIPATSISIPSFPPTNPTNLPPQLATNLTNYPSQSSIPSSFHSIPSDLLSNSTSSSTSSDLELEGRRKRKMKWKDFFERLMKEVIEKQEELQKKFLEAIEKREHERMVREEAWRMQEMSRINREREILSQERSMAAAKDAAVMTFLQRIAEQQNPGGQVVQNTNNPPPIAQAAPPAPTPSSQPPSLQPQPLPPAPAPAPALQPQPSKQPQPQSQQIISLDTMKTENGNRNHNFMGTSSSRWPKVEVEALIKMRTSLDSKYQENGPKGPLWEEISAGMRKLGYNRSSKRCKEKWENINKYFKKVKESDKKRPEDSKTCPYFHQLDALYKEKHKLDSSSNQLFKPENSVPLMVQPEQQWPPRPEHQQRQDSAMEDVESDQNVEEDDKDEYDEDDDDVGGFEIVPNKQVQVNSMDANE